MMRVADYFCSTTKEIRYLRHHFMQVKECDGKISLTRWHLSEGIPPDATPEERMNEIKMIEPQSLHDNALLIRAIEKIGKALDTEQWNFTGGFMWQLLPLYGEEEVLDKQIIIGDLTALYMLFQCYRVLIWEDQSIPEAYQKIIRQDFPQANEQSFNDQPSLEDICRYYVENMTSMRNIGIMSQIQLTSQIQTDDGETFREVIVAETLFEALFYQMLLHFVAGKEGLNGYRLEECQSCHEIYKKRHGNQRFCPQCSRNSERVRAYKARKKEAVAHE